MFFISLFDIITPMKENTKDKIYTGFTVFVIMLILTIGVFNWWPVLKRHSNLKDKEADLVAKIEEVKNENNRVSEARNRFKTSSEQVEAVARQDHRVYPGEVVYKFSESGKK